MGHLIGPNRAAWYDFFQIKNFKFPVFPIIRNSNDLDFYKGMIFYGKYD